MALNARTNLAAYAKAVSPLRRDAMPHAGIHCCYVALLCLGNGVRSGLVGSAPATACGGAPRIIACIEATAVIKKILSHLDTKDAFEPLRHRPPIADVGSAPVRHAWSNHFGWHGCGFDVS